MTKNKEKIRPLFSKVQPDQISFLCCHKWPKKLIHCFMQIEGRKKGERGEEEGEKEDIEEGDGEEEKMEE